MAMLDRYLQELLMQGDNATEQAAIESAIFNQKIPLSYQLWKDRETIEYEKPRIITHYLKGQSEQNQSPSLPAKPAKKSKRPSSAKKLITARNPAPRRASLRKPHKGIAK
jgi:hypothetical protein